MLAFVLVSQTKQIKPEAKIPIQSSDFNIFNSRGLLVTLPMNDRQSTQSPTGESFELDCMAHSCTVSFWCIQEVRVGRGDVKCLPRTADHSDNKNFNFDQHFSPSPLNHQSPYPYSHSFHPFSELHTSLHFFMQAIIKKKNNNLQ